MTLFADIDAQGWAVIIAAVCVGVVGILSSIGAIITGVVTLVLQSARERAKIERDAVTAREVKEVRTTLETNTARTEGKLEQIHGFVNSAMLEQKRMYAEKCRDSAKDTPTAANKAEAERAQKVYEAHRVETEEMEREKRAAPIVHESGPITSAELKKDILETPVKVVAEMKKQEQSPPEGVS